jgi:NAD(P)-dependent dehydrogenase (short-subunit alcohol dehydrogenase family)
VNGTKIDVLVNNAGFGAQGQFAALPLERQLDMVQVNVTAVTHLTRLFLPSMIERGHGGILNVASTAAFQPGPGMAVYYASKAFVLSLSEAVAEELAGTGVTVTALCPGPTDTNFAEAANAKFTRLFKKSAMSPEAVARMGHSAFRKGHVVAIAGMRNQLLALAVRVAPRAIVRKIAKRLNQASYAPRTRAGRLGGSDHSRSSPVDAFQFTVRRQDGHRYRQGQALTARAFRLRMFYQMDHGTAMIRRSALGWLRGKEQFRVTFHVWGDPL